MTGTGYLIPNFVKTGGGSLQSPPPAVDDIWNLSVRLLEQVRQIYARVGIALPSRQYVTLGTPAQDCEQVTVAFQQTYIGPPGDEASTPQRCDGPRSAVFQITITRCVPTVDAKNRVPTPEQMEPSTQALMQDAWLLLSTSQELDDYLGVIATVEATDPAGGLQSIVMTLTLGVP
jgi:hypothetical protein